MLRYTARWFLSRTIRTVLSKYLLDIDVDSVYIPYGEAAPNEGGGRSASSSHADDDGPDSGGGWGIHLSNVRLREGVTLMMLPGRRKRVATVQRKRKKRPRPMPGPGTGPEPEFHQPDERVIDQAPQTPIQPPPEFIHDNDAGGNSGHGVYLSPTPSYEECDLSDPNSDCGGGVLLGGDTSRDGVGDGADFDLDLDIDDHGRGGRVLGYASPPRSAASFASGTRTPYSSSSPPTPSGPSWACFARGGRSTPVPATSPAALAAPYNIEDKPKHQHTEQPHLPDVTLGPLRREDDRSGDVAVPPMRPSARNSGFHGEALGGIDTTNVGRDTVGDENTTTDGDNEDEFEYYEEETTFEQTMELKVGHGGRIGTLHAKIVGKDYHITVEDADLTLEIAPKPVPTTGVAGEAKEEEEAEDGLSVSVDGAEASSTHNSKVPEENAAAGRNASSTTEDRVMQNSRLARYLAAVPNLYLRDCRVRIVLKDDDSSREGGTETTYETATGENGEASADDNLSSTTYVIGIDFLSVTGGEDFLAHARTGQGDHSDSENTQSGQIRNAPSFREDAIEDPQNEFLRKRVRTGKGPEGGMFIQVISPLQDKRRYPQYYAGRSNVSRAAALSAPPSQVGTRWAVKTFAAATEMCLLRLSGLDIRARILLGRHKELVAAAAETASTTDDAANDYYFDYDGELVMLGSDYFSAGAAPNNDETVDHMEKGEVADEEITSDEIETIPVQSNFHRIGRGMRRHGCKAHTHLPCHDCSHCWSYTVQSAPRGKYDTDADASMPLPGLVLYFAITDPVELNIERQGLEAVNALKSLFVPDSTGTSQDAKTDNDGTDATSSSGERTICEAKGHDATAGDAAENTFPSFMKPEAVHIVGVHIANICLRLQAMKRDGGREDGLAFSYWEMQIGALTGDSQNLNAKELVFKDMRISIGQVLLYELRGVCRKRLVRLGLDPAETTSSDDCVDNAAAAPSTQLCTAATILGISSSFEALRLLQRYENAVHFRFINIPVSSEIHPTQCVPMGRRCIDIKVGSIDADLPPGFISGIMTAKNEAMAALMDSPCTVDEKDRDTSPNPSSSSETPTPPPSLLEYAARLDGGKFHMRPRIKCGFPATTFSGQSSSDEGFSIHSVLNRVKFEYGKRNSRSDLHLSPSKSNVGIRQLAQLSEASRMGILFYLDDLRNLEKALGMKESPTHFFVRCRNICQRLGQLDALLMSSGGSRETKSQARKGKHAKPKASSSAMSSSKSDRKHHLVEKLKSLSVDELESLLATHGRG